MSVGELMCLNCYTLFSKCICCKTEKPMVNHHEDSVSVFHFTISPLLLPTPPHMSNLSLILLYFIFQGMRKPLEFQIMR